MAEFFEFYNLKSRIMTSFDTLPLDVYFGHLLTGSNFSDCPCGGGGDGDNDEKNYRTTEEGEDEDAIHPYQNFRTLPDGPAQFLSLAIDPGGGIAVADTVSDPFW